MNDETLNEMINNTRMDMESLTMTYSINIDMGLTDNALSEITEEILMENIPSNTTMCLHNGFVTIEFCPQVVKLSEDEAVNLVKKALSKNSDRILKAHEKWLN